jgi:hypothetical protein
MVKVTRVKSDAGKNLTVALDNLQGKVGKVGWFEGSKYPDKKSTPVAYVAAIHEYGYPAKNIPARPFMRPTIIAKQNEWRQVAARGAKSILKGHGNVADVMEAVGAKAAGDIRKTITQIYSPPLKPATIAARLRNRANKKTVGRLNKPLIDTKEMYNTLTNTVEDE